MFEPTQPGSKHSPQVLRGPIKSAERPTIGLRPTTGHSVIREITGFLIGVKLRVYIGQL